MEEKKCLNCRYFLEGFCGIPLYIEGDLYRGRLVLPDESCFMFEAAEREVPVEEPA